MSRDLVVLSHLRWSFVWQRPQHLISRVAAGYDRAWFVEEPEAVTGLAAPTWQVESAGPVSRVWLQVPAYAAMQGYDAAACKAYAAELPQVLGETAGERAVWLYTPMALDVARALAPTLLVYDVMDDLASFRFAPPELVLRQRQALREADLVFTGGRSLHRSIQEHRSKRAHCFPSGVEPEHYAPAKRVRRSQRRSRPVAGYVGVIDERLDLDLIAELADELHDWHIQMVGPVVKIDEADLPQAANLEYPGSRTYKELPAVMGGFDVALMPFALNEATRSISPTKTLEYFAAGLPVVSTRVPDVVADYQDSVWLADDARDFAKACDIALNECPDGRAERLAPILRRQHWDAIAARMTSLIDDASAAATGKTA
ncbi:MAG: UDP-galactopyranose mutase [Actinomycetota bacterium]|jgi:glycosyltransferase involved in cell wall biosynthesis